MQRERGREGDHRRPPLPPPASMISPISLTEGAEHDSSTYPAFGDRHAALIHAEQDHLRTVSVSEDIRNHDVQEKARAREDWKDDYGRDKLCHCII